MSDPDIKLDREILAKIHNEVKIISNRMDYMDVKIDEVMCELIQHIKLCDDQSKDFIFQVNKLTEIINGDNVKLKVGIYSDKEKPEDK